MRIVTIGASVQARPIDAYVRGRGDEPTILVFGGFHGDESKGVFVARQLIEWLDADGHAGAGVRWIVVPTVNPDGYERRKRRNARQVDINRNFPTQNWTTTSARSRMFGGCAPASEPETRAVIEAVRRYCPGRIISVHSIDRHRFANNFDGPGRAIACAMRRFNRYPVTSSVGYPTPGSFGTWAGVERNIPTVTLELPSHHSPQRCWNDNRLALLAAAGRP